MTYGKQYIPKRKKSELKRLKKQRLNVIKKSLRQKYTKTKQKYKIGLLKRIIKNYHVKENTHV